ncbi:MAG: 50S ribosomal protein L3 [Patescibacteria group bacterium]
MMKFLLGRKLEMTTLWNETGRAVPITVIEAGPCQVTQVKTKERDGYTAVQVGFGKKKHSTKPAAGHLKDLPTFAHLREVRLDSGADMARGATLTVSQFQPGDKVEVAGISKGKGFQGVVKRHHFAGHPATHGHKDQERMPGSIGAGGVQHVRKGMRMAGRMGGERVTVKNLKVIAVDEGKNLLQVKGAVPGAKNALLVIYCE